jgi:hypothetical protein
MLYFAGIQRAQVIRAVIPIVERRIACTLDTRSIPYAGTARHDVHANHYANGPDNCNP